MSNSFEQVAQTTLLATFSVRDRLCALDAATVQEVIRLGALTPVHNAPFEVAGVINLRGRIVTVIDVGLKLGAPKLVPSRDARIFIIEERHELIGLLVDHVGEVVELDVNQLEPLPANLPPSQAPFFRGVCRAGGRVTTWLNPAAF